jgi:hypothetical protein
LREELQERFSPVDWKMGIWTDILAVAPNALKAIQTFEAWR